MKNQPCDRIDPKAKARVDAARPPSTELDLRLVLPAQEHEQEAMAYRQEHIGRGEPKIHGSGGLMNDDGYAHWLATITRIRTIAPFDWVPCSTFFAVVGDRIVGTTQIRHALTDALIRTAGHIGYSVRPSERQKGYATKMLALALEECRALGIERALVTCDADNIASAKTIRKGGGVFESEAVDENRNIVHRYWIAL